MTEINYKDLPVRAQRREDEISELVAAAIDMGWEISMVDYNTGMIKFKMDGMAINLYSTTFTVVIERENHKGVIKQRFRTKLPFEAAVNCFFDPVNA